MSYTREQRAANAAKAAAKAAESVASPAASQVETSSVEPSETVQGDTNPRPESRNRPRDDAFAEIEAREERVRKEQESAPKPAEAESAPEATATAEATGSPVEPVVEMVKVKVDGEEFEVSKSDVDEAGGVRAYQTLRAAENRLRKTNETLAESRKMQSQLAAIVEQQAPKAPNLTDAQFIAQKVDAIRFGTPEESAAALQEVMARGRVDENSIIQKAAMHIQKQAAVDSFAKEFQDVVANPLLLTLARALENERGPKQGPTTNWSEFYRKIGNEVRSVAGRSSQPTTTAVAPAKPAAPTADSTSQASEKEARKASIVNLPTAAARAAATKEENPGTPEEQRAATLRQMKQSRGLSTD